MQRLARTEERIGALVAFIADGDKSAYVRQALLDMEAQARTEQAAIAALKNAARAPVALPSPDELVERARDLERVVSAEPLAARERLRGLFVDGRILLRPAPEGATIVEAVFLPLVALSGHLGAQTAGAALGGEDKGSVATPLRLVVPKPPDRRRKKG